MKRRHGLSLLEVLIAAALLSVLAAACLPLLQRVGGIADTFDRAKDSPGSWNAHRRSSTTPSHLESIWPPSTRVLRSPGRRRLTALPCSFASSRPTMSPRRPNRRREANPSRSRSWRGSGSSFLVETTMYRTGCRNDHTCVGPHLGPNDGRRWSAPLPSGALK